MAVRTYPSGFKPTMRGAFAVVVDSLEVERLLAGLMTAISPTGLALWMTLHASPLLGNLVIGHFDDGSGTSYGPWPPLQESTIRIKEALGAPDPEAINDRTQAMLTALVTDHDVSAGVGGAVLVAPGDISDGVLRQKLETAAFGKTQGSGDMIPGAYTPPRPVNRLDAIDMVMFVSSLERYIMTSVAGVLGGSGLIPLGTTGRLGIRAVP